MTVLDDLVALLIAESIAPSDSIFVSSVADIPPDEGPYLSLVGTGGREPIGTHNDMVDIERPSVQITVRATDYKDAERWAMAAYVLLRGIRNQVINGTFYQEIRAMQVPYDLGADAQGRARCAFNLRITRDSAPGGSMTT
jgi:hypothetical protein